MERWLSYDQISLIPTQVSTVAHRADVDTSVKFGPIDLEVPIIAAPMPDVSNGKMAGTLRSLGSMGWVHRFQSDTEQYRQASLTPWLSGYIIDPGIGIGIGLEYNEDALRDLYACGARIFCIDVANGASVRVQKALGNLKDTYPDIFIVAGNVASSEAFQALESWGADAIRVGIAGGSVCETRTETGVYSPMASAIANIPQWVSMYDKPLPKPIPEGWTNVEGLGISRPRKALLIADGGISEPGQMCKALALGADLVMMGGALAGTKESPGPVINVDGKLKKRLAGAASYVTQKEANGEEPNYVEGAETLVEYRGSVKKVIDRFEAGLRSSMSYMNSMNLTEYRKHVKIVEI